VSFLSPQADMRIRTYLRPDVKSFLENSRRFLRPKRIFFWQGRRKFNLLRPGGGTQKRFYYWNIVLKLSPAASPIWQNGIRRNIYKSLDNPGDEGNLLCLAYFFQALSCAGAGFIKF
jgi:hypothetical protein